MSGTERNPRFQFKMKFFKRFWKSRRPNVVDKSETIIPLRPSTPTSEKVEQENSTNEETQSSLTSSEISQLSRLLTKFCTSAPSAQVTALLSKYSSTENDCTRNNGPLEDWAQNVMVLDKIFSYLGARDLKLVRLVCKSWARVAATPLAEKCILNSTRGSRLQINQLHESSVQIHLFRSFLCFERTKLHNFGFKLRHVRLDLSTQSENHVWRNYSWITDLVEFFSSASFQPVRSLELCGLDCEFNFDLMIPHWLPAYGKKLKTLKLVETRDDSGRFVLQTTKVKVPPPPVQLDLETFFIEFDPIGGLYESYNWWNFIRNCSQLKHLSLKEARRSLHLPTQNHHRYRENILLLLGKTRLETLELQLSALKRRLDEVSTSDWEPFPQRLLQENGQNLKTFSLTLFIGAPGSWAVPKLPLAPSVKLVKYSLQSITTLIRLNNLKIAQFLPLMFHQLYTDGRRVEINFNDDFNLIVKSPRELLLNLTQLYHLHGGSEENSLVLPTVLQRMFPDINYVCCASQSPADSGLSVRTTLVEHLGKEGVFDISGTLKSGCVGRNDHLIAYHLYEYENEFFRRGGASFRILEPQIVRGAALNIEEWSDEDLKVMRGAAFVFGHVPENKMPEAWAKVQRNVCTDTSMFEQQQFTPEVVKSGQGSYTFCRQFTSWTGESYGELCTRFQLDQVDQDC